MRAGHIKENNASKYVTRRGPKISRPKISIVHNYLKICKTICGASLITSFYFHSIPKQIWGDKHFETGQITSRLYGRNCKLFLTPLSRNSQERLEHKENQTKNRDMTRIPRNQVRIIVMYSERGSFRRKSNERSVKRKPTRLKIFVFFYFIHVVMVTSEL